MQVLEQVLVLVQVQLQLAQALEPQRLELELELGPEQLRREQLRQLVPEQQL